MPTMRSSVELAALCAEAERRVRAGESRAEVARALGVAATTLSQWALRGRWRRKDLEAERGGELARRADELIARLRTDEAGSKEKAERERRDALAMLEAMKARVREAEAARAEAVARAEEAIALAERERDAAIVERESAGEGRADAEEPEPMELARASMAKAQRLMREDRLDEAECAARMTWRFLGAAERIELREERISSREEGRRRKGEQEVDEAGREEERAVIRQKLGDLLERLEREARGEILEET